MENKIVIIGSINQDVVIQIDKIPRPGETLFGKTLSYFPGGKGANQAVASKILGGNVIFVGKVGDDLFGSNMKEYLATVGLSNRVQTEAGVSTGAAVIYVDKQGENAISVISGANSMFNENDLSILDELIPDDVILLQNEINLQIIFDAIKKAKSKGVKIFYNPAPAIKIPEETITLCDYIIVNEHELEVCFNLPDIDFKNINGLATILSNLSRKYKFSPILTLGADGYIAVQDNKVYRGEGLKVCVIDTTGAGDCFCGALVTFASKGYDLQESLLFANKAAALSVTKLGASSSFPKFDDVK
ncbi:MAG: ribokinase [Candidatus Bathyarchaeota archaeon]|nr:ribokinase [Candidatus Termiticorpusculum sp.]